MSKYLEEFVVGEKYTTPARTITETDVVMFGCTTGDLHRNHMNAEAMKGSQFGQRIAHGLLGLSMAHGLFYAIDLIRDTAIAFLAVENWEFKAPIFFGDTIHCEITIADVIYSRSKHDRGVVKFKFEVYNQNGVLTQTGIKSIMMMRKPA